MLKMRSVLPPAWKPGPWATRRASARVMVVVGLWWVLMTSSIGRIPP